MKKRMSKKWKDQISKEAINHQLVAVKLVYPEGGGEL